MDEEYLKTMQVLKKYEQEQLLKFYSELSKHEKNNLLNEIKLINFEQMKQLYAQTKIKDKIGKNVIESIEYINKEKLTKEKLNYYIQIGEKSIKNNEYAVVTMAGGQRD